ncbi:MAG TPA: hypothetical protein VJZ27_17670, partial [Aggregatilineales bacterium]|nr:hypothetical protein [Aggregatilineales bacterium]
EEISAEDLSDENSGIGKRTIIIGLTGFIMLMVVAAIGYKLTTSDKESEIAPSTLEDSAACAMDSPAPSGDGVDSLLEFVNRERDGSEDGTNPGWFEDNPTASGDDSLFTTTGFNVLDTCSLPSEQ